jgi:HptB-dependent secretion and biofilm anti anti-sigma factor
MIETRLEDDGTQIIVRMTGQLNFSANESFETLVQDLVTKGRKRTVLDLAKVTHIDSVGLGLLYIAKEDLAAGGATLCLKSPQGMVMRLLELTDANKSFEIER